MKKALALMDAIASTVRRIHSSYQLSLKGLLAGAMDRRDAHTPRTRVDLSRSLRLARVESMSLAQAALRAGLDEVVSAAHEDSRLDIDVETQLGLNSLIDHAFDAAEALIEDALKMDERSVLQTLRSTQLSAFMKSAQGIDPEVAFDMVRTGVVASVDFRRRDRAGSRWSTTVYSHTVARGLLVDSYVETFLTHLVANGFEVASIPGDDGVDVLFSISGQSTEMPGLEEIEKDYLHPNASRLVSR